MDGVEALGGVTVRSPSQMQFTDEREECACIEDPRDLLIDKEDFRVAFDAARQRWTVEWKWSVESCRLISKTA